MKPKLFFVTTIPGSLVFFEGQYTLLSECFDITAISSNPNELEFAGKKYGVKVHCIPMEREISLLTDIRGLFKFIGYFRKERPSIVHGNTPKGSLLSMLAAWITRVPVRIYMCHGLRYQGCAGFKKRLLMLMERISCWCATDIICVSKGVAKVLKEDKITVKEPVVVWNGSVKGIDTQRFNPDNSFNKDEIREKCGVSSNNFVLTFVGRIVTDKGVNELVEAFSILSKRYENMRLLLVGSKETNSNTISQETRRLIDENDSIIEMGQQSDIPGILSITNLFVFPSYREGFGLSLMEAGAMGVPAISTDIIGCSEVVEDEKTGILIQPHSSQAIVDAVEKLYNDRGLYENIRNQSRQSIVSRYEQNELWRRYKEFYLSKINF